MQRSDERATAMDVCLRRCPGVLNLLGVAVLAAGIAGCGKATEPMGVLQGQVTSAGKPVAEAVVVLEGVSAPLAVQISADENGRYTFAKLPGGGLPPGTYRAAVQPPIVAGQVGQPLPPPKPFPQVDPRYLDPARSGLQVEVKAGENTYDIELPPKK